MTHSWPGPCIQDGGSDCLKAESQEVGAHIQDSLPPPLFPPATSRKLLDADPGHLEAGPLTQVAGKHKQQKVLVAGRQPRKAGTCRVVWEVTGRGLAGPAKLTPKLPLSPWNTLPGGVWSHSSPV